MKTLPLAALLITIALTSQAGAQTALPADQAATGGAAPSSKVNVAVRADVAARPVTHNDAPATVGGVPVRTARMGGKTVTLQNGSLPDAEASTQASAPGA